jgi:hypothetical protein
MQKGEVPAVGRVAGERFAAGQRGHAPRRAGRHARREHVPLVRGAGRPGDLVAGRRPRQMPRGRRYIGNGTRGATDRHDPEPAQRDGGEPVRVRCQCEARECAHVPLLAGLRETHGRPRATLPLERQPRAERDRGRRAAGRGDPLDRAIRGVDERAAVREPAHACRGDGGMIGQPDRRGRLAGSGKHLRPHLQPLQRVRREVRDATTVRRIRDVDRADGFRRQRCGRAAVGTNLPDPAGCNERDTSTVRRPGGAVHGSRNTFDRQLAERARRHVEQRDAARPASARRVGRRRARERDRRTIGRPCRPTRRRVRIGHLHQLHRLRRTGAGAEVEQPQADPAAALGTEHDASAVG